MKVNNKYILLLCTTLFSLLSCYQSIEDCLDNTASNFNPEADDNCCCEYPVLTFKLEYTLGNELFETTDTLNTGQGPEFRLIDFQVVGGDVLFYGGIVTASMMKEEDMTLLSSMGSTIVRRKDDAFLFNPRRFTHEVGTFVFDGLLDSIRFSLVPNLFKGIDPNSFEDDNHPLRVADNEGIWMDSMYLISMTFEFDQDTTTLLMPFDNEIVITKSVAITFETGVSKTITYQLNLLEWLNGVDVSTITVEKLKTVLRENIDNAINIII